MQTWWLVQGHGVGGDPELLSADGFPFTNQTLLILGSAEVMSMAVLEEVEALIAFHNAARKLGIGLVWSGGRRRCWGAVGVLSQLWGPRVGGCQELPCSVPSV